MEAMESLEVMDNGVESCSGEMDSLEVIDNGVKLYDGGMEQVSNGVEESDELCNGGMEQLSNGVEESDHRDVDILEDLDSYMEELNDRLTISRMVSDSVIKGIVTAVTEEAAKEISEKEREVTKLKEMLHVHHVGVDGNEFVGSSVNWDGKMKEISSIRDELDAISKSLSVSDNGQLSSHLSLEGEEENNNFRKGASSHHKVLNYLKSASSLPVTLTTAAATLSSSASSSSSLCEENGIHDEIETNMEEHLDRLLLKHMNTDELLSHCKNEITKLKRNHELQIQDLTEQHFRHRRELLREMGPSLTSKKNKEFDMLKIKISEVISKVDNILVEKEEVNRLTLHKSGSNEESMASLKDKVESLYSENCQLRDLLKDKNREIKCLSLQISKASENISQHTMTEAKLLKTVGDLNSAMEDAHVEAVIAEDVFAGIFSEVVDEIRCIAEESQVENSILHEVYKSIFAETFIDAEPATKCVSDNVNMESIIMQELCDIIFNGALKDAEEKLNELNIKYIDEKKLRVLHETEKLDKEKQLEVEVSNKERLRQEVLILVEEKEQLARDAAAALATEKERYELAAQEVISLRHEICQHQKLISENLEVSNSTKCDLVEAQEQNDRHKADIFKLEQHLAVAAEELRKVEEDRKRLLDINQEKHIAVSLLKAKERELTEKFESIAVSVSEILKSFTDFECQVTKDLSVKCSRLKSLTSQSHVLKQKADVLVRRGTLYKQRFEKKCSDLEKAEAEVDLLGDEVETLLNLVEKIYIALDHYSPILQHYPGITEILKLVKRELSPDK